MVKTSAQCNTRCFYTETLSALPIICMEEGKLLVKIGSLCCRDMRVKEIPFKVSKVAQCQLFIAQAQLQRLTIYFN